MGSRPTRLWLWCAPGLCGLWLSACGAANEPSGTAADPNSADSPQVTIAGTLSTDAEEQADGVDLARSQTNGSLRAGTTRTHAKPLPEAVTRYNADSPVSQPPLLVGVDTATSNASQLATVTTSQPAAVLEATTPPATNVTMPAALLKASAQTDSSAADAKESSPLQSAFNTMVAAFQGEKPENFTAAEQTLLDAGAKALPLLFAELRGGETSERELATMLILRILPETVLNDETVTLRQRETYAAPLLAALRDESAEVRANVAATLTLFPEVAEQTVPALLELTGHQQDHLRLMAAVSLGNLPPSPQAAEQKSRERAVQELLDDTNRDVASAAAQTLKNWQATNTTNNRPTR